MKKSGLFYPVLLLIFWGGMTLLADYVVISTTVKQALARGYRPVTARIVESEIGRSTTRRSGVIFEYNYRVNGVEYTGHRYRYDDRNAVYQYSDATNTYPRWAEISVFYNPRDPGDSVINPGVDGSDLLLLLLALPLNVATATICGAAFLSVRKNRRLGPAGGVRIWTEDGGRRVRLAEVSSIAVGWFVLGAACFCSAFPLVSFCGFEPSMRVMETVWALVALAGAAGFLWMHRRNKRGYYDLRLQPGAGTVTLPAVAGRSYPLSIARGDILGVSLFMRVTTNPSGTHTSYVPALLCSDSEPLNLVRWGWNQDRAEDFGRWLGQELKVDFKGAVAERPRTG